jgi:starch-binding outer membrane protein, SusD/RagB family
MKNFHKSFIVLLLVFASVFYGCEDWLDVTSSSQIRAEEQFSSEDGFKDALIGVYINMTEPSLYSRDMTWNLVDILSQQYASQSSQALLYDAQSYAYQSVRLAPRIAAFWTGGYNVIANINNALAYMEESPELFDPINYNLIRGELLGLRAFIHFDLYRLYGYGGLADRPEMMDEFTIPYVTEYGKDITPQETVETTFGLMLADIEEALDLLTDDPVYDDPNRPSGYFDVVNQNGFYEDRKNRMNYYAVKALQARVYAWKGGADDLELAREAAEEVIDYSMADLINADTYPVGNDPILYQENLFTLYVSGFEDIVNNFIDASSQTNYDAVYMTNDRVQSVFETQNSNVGLPDIRYNTLLEQQSLGYVSIKHYQRGSLNNSNQIALIKLPEMYYIAAEAYIEEGQLNTAIDLLNRVRESRGIIEEIDEASTEEEVREELFKEIRKEFVSEGQLFFYYKRIGLETIPGLSASVTADDDIYVLPLPDSEIEFRN